MAEGDELGPVWKRLGEHGESIARLDAEVDALRASHARFETSLAELRGDVRSGHQEMRQRFDQLAAAVGEAHSEALKAVSPDFASRMADQARSVGLMRALLGTAVVVIVSLAGFVAANIPATTAPMIHFRNQPTPCQDTSPIVKIP